ncbi:MAG: molecular chaperone [Alphaproteobacteria bacterium]|nr:molecular chaperone [Alphaproteobacteria bacterium]
MGRLVRLLFAVTAAVSIGSDAVWGAALEFIPIRIELPAGQAATILEIRNHGGAVAVQVRGFVWRQKGDTDELSQTEEIIVSPPIFKIADGGSQTVRLLLRRRDSKAEHEYRLIIDELPPPATERRQIVIALQASLPVFAEPVGESAEQLAWRAERGPGGILLAAHNTGHRYAMVRALSASLPDGHKIAPSLVGNNPYVLPGAERHWLFTNTGALALGSVLHLTVTSEAGTQEETVRLPR